MRSISVNDLPSLRAPSSFFSPKVELSANQRGRNHFPVTADSERGEEGHAVLRLAVLVVPQSDGHVGETDRQGSATPSHPDDDG